jgi:protein phosphatase
MIPFPSHLLIAHDTHAGESGKNNEDHHAVHSFRAGGEGSELVTVAVVADGIGGHRAGEVASEMATQIVMERAGQWPGGDYRTLLSSAFGEAARQIAARAHSSSDLHGMGTTCAMAVVAGRRLFIAYAGDSRIYLIRNNTIRQISVDHTWIQEAIDYKLITREEGRTHPNRHVVRRHLGGKPDVQPDFRLRLADGESKEQSEQNQGLTLNPGDAVLLCSDGLTDLVEDPEILEAGLTRPDDLDGAVAALIQLARERGGHDNITVVILQVPE